MAHRHSARSGNSPAMRRLARRRSAARLSAAYMRHRLEYARPSLAIWMSRGLRFMRFSSDGWRKGCRGEASKSHANTSEPGVDLPTRNLIRKKQEENPLLGEWRMYAALKQLGISVSPRTCGRIMAENRQLYGIKPPSKEPHQPKSHPFTAAARHERWCVDIRYIEKHRIPEIKGSFYVITVMDAFSRAILSSDIFQSQDL